MEDQLRFYLALFFVLIYFIKMENWELIWSDLMYVVVFWEFNLGCEMIFPGVGWLGWSNSWLVSCILANLALVLAPLLLEWYERCLSSCLQFSCYGGEFWYFDFISWWAILNDLFSSLGHIIVEVDWEERIKWCLSCWKLYVMTRNYWSLSRFFVFIQYPKNKFMLLVRGFFWFCFLNDII